MCKYVGMYVCMYVCVCMYCRGVVKDAAGGLLIDVLGWAGARKDAKRRLPVCVSPLVVLSFWMDGISMSMSMSMSMRNINRYRMFQYPGRLW